MASEELKVSAEHQSQVEVLSRRSVYEYMLRKASEGTGSYRSPFRVDVDPRPE